MSLLQDFVRVSKSRPCPLCSHGDWCLVSRDDPPSRAICPRTESARRIGEAGWMHQLREVDEYQVPHSRIRRVRIDVPPKHDFAAMAEAYARAVDVDRLQHLGRHLGITNTSLQRLRIGWTGRAWSFPMTDAAGVVRGIRLRLPDGRKLAVKGGREGLFVPTSLRNDGPLFIAEGPTDTAALLDLGVDAVGRPSCSGGMRLVMKFVRSRSQDRVVIVADGDAPGQRGAATLACVLALHVRHVSAITPPAPHKDVRAWVNAGATPIDIANAVRSATTSHVVVRARRRSA